MEHSERNAVRPGRGARECSLYQTEIDRIIFALVPVKSRFEAIAKAAVALHRRPQGQAPTEYGQQDQGPTFELIHRYDESALQMFAGTWGILPDAVPVTSEVGRSLLSKALRNTSGFDSGPTQIEAGSECGDTNLVEKSGPRLYDEAGRPIERRSQLTALLAETGTSYLKGIQKDSMVSENRRDGDPLSFDSATEELWIVPAVAFRVEQRRDSSDRETFRDSRAGPRRCQLHCGVCGTSTVHRFGGVERFEDTSETVDHPAGELSDIFVDEYTTELSIWNCSECNDSREGPPLT